MPASAQSPTSRIEASGIAPALSEQFDNELARIVRRKDVEHAVIAIENVDRTRRWVGAAGDADAHGTPMQPDTRFFIASVTKLYIAASIFKLYERGLVQLDAPIANYLPGTLIDGIHVLDGVDYTDRITVTHLLGHSSGLPDFLEDRPEGGVSMFERLMNEDSAWTMEDVTRIVRESLTPHFPPGSLEASRQRIRYSDTNYQLLIEIIRQVTGKSLHSSFSEMIYQPLGLTQTAHPGVNPQADLATATVWNGDDPLEIPLAMQSFADLSSTVDEMMQFMRELITGRIFDRPSTLDVMQGRWNRFDFSLNPASISPSWPIEYGLGMMRFRMPRIFTPLRPIPGVIGHTGVSGSWLFYSPRLDTLLAGTVDQVTASPLPFRLIPRLLRLLDVASN